MTDTHGDLDTEGPNKKSNWGIGEEDEAKYDSFVFQEEQSYSPQMGVGEQAKKTKVSSKRYKQNLRFDPLMIEEEILLEGDQQQIPTGWRQVVFFLKLSSFWFANALLLACLVTIVWPSQIATIVGDEKKEAFNGYTPALGAFVSLVITPVAGILSDYSSHPWGRRRVYIVSGSCICILFLVWGASFGAGSNIWLLMLCSAGIQFGANWAAGPYAGLLPDLVPRELIGLASGYLGLMLAVGDLVGIVVAGQITSSKTYWPVYIFIAATYTVGILPTVLGIKERSRANHAKALTPKVFVKAFTLNPKEYRDFFWVLLTRFLEQMGVYSILPFLQYFMKDVVHTPSPEKWASVMIALLVVSSIPSSIIGGKLSDKYGRKPLVYISSGLLALGMVLLIFLTLAPSLGAMMGVGVLMGLGYGAYQAVDWALALDVLPHGANIAKDMGIWHVAVVFPQVISPMITGQVLDALKPVSIQTGYTVVCAISAMWFILATVFVYPVQRVNTERASREVVIEDDL